MHTRSSILFYLNGGFLHYNVLLVTPDEISKAVLIDNLFQGDGQQNPLPLQPWLSRWACCPPTPCDQSSPAEPRWCSRNSTDRPHCLPSSTTSSLLFFIVQHRFHGDQEFRASLSLWASLNFGPQFNALENTMRAFLGTNLNINPRSWVCHQRLSGFAIYFTFSIIGYSKRRRHRSQKPIHSGPNKWIFIGSLVCIWLSLGSINPQIVKPHWPQPLALRKNRPLGMELWKFLENLLSEISPKSKEFMMDQQRMIWHLMIRERQSYFRTCRPIHQVLNNHPLSLHCQFHNMNFTNASLAVG